MTTINRKLSGCYKRVLTFLLVLVVIGLAIGVLAYRQVGGLDGARHWMAKYALGNVEKHLKAAEQRPDGISEQQIVENFQRVREAIEKRQVNLTSLYTVLKSYQTEFNVRKPSTPEIQEFLQSLGSTIIADTGGKQ